MRTFREQPPIGSEDERRFWALVNRADAQACWTWSGPKIGNGYGRFNYAGKSWSAHRVAYVLATRDPIPDGLVLDHLCRNTMCVNPAHLEIVTERTNVLRGVSFVAVKATQVACKHGHPFTAENTWRRNDGRRICRECNRLALRRNWASENRRKRG